MKKIAVLALVAVAGVANAQQTFSFTGVESREGAGNVANQLRSVTFSNSFLWDGSVTVSGNLTNVIAGNWASEARFRVQTSSNGLGTLGSGLTTTQTFTTLAVGPATRSFTGISGAPFNPSGQTWNLEFFESFNDGAGADSSWDDISITFNAFVPPTPPSCINLGTWNATQIDTDGSFQTPGGPRTDTELGLYNSSGILVANNDDIASSNFNSILSGLSLADGATYYLAVGGFNTAFGNGFGVTPGTATGAFTLNINGVAGVATGALASGAVNWYCFTAPAPSALALLGLGGVVAGRRRR
jgi:MYXO-CTERM domain-containing protein